MSIWSEFTNRFDESSVGDTVEEHRKIVGFSVVEKDNIMGLFKTDELLLFSKYIAVP